MSKVKYVIMSGKTFKMVERECIKQREKRIIQYIKTRQGWQVWDGKWECHDTRTGDYD